MCLLLLYGFDVSEFQETHQLVVPAAEEGPAEEEQGVQAEPAVKVGVAGEMEL